MRWLLAAVLLGCGAPGAQEADTALDVVTTAIETPYGLASAWCTASHLHSAEECPSREQCEAQHAAIDTVCLHGVTQAGEALRAAQMAAREATTAYRSCGAETPDYVACGRTALVAVNSAQVRLERAVDAWEAAQAQALPVLTSIGAPRPRSNITSRLREAEAARQHAAGRIQERFPRVQQ